MSRQFPPSVIDRLQTLSNLLVLADQRNHQLQELAEARSERCRGLAMNKVRLAAGR